MLAIEKRYLLFFLSKQFGFNIYTEQNKNTHVHVVTCLNQFIGQVLKLMYVHIFVRVPDLDFFFSNYLFHCINSANVNLKVMLSSDTKFNKTIYAVIQPLSHMFAYRIILHFVAICQMSNRPAYV